MLTALAAAQGLLVGGVLLTAAVSKFRDLARGSAGQDDMLARWIGGRRAVPARWILFALELALAAQLLAGVGDPRWAGAGAAGLFGSAALLLAVTRRRSPDTPCGCFGAHSDQPIDGATVARAAVLALLSLASVFGPADLWSATLGEPVAVLALGLEALAFVWLSPEFSVQGAFPAEWIRDAELRRAVRTARRSPAFRRLRGRLRSAWPVDAWADPDDGNNVVLFDMDASAPTGERYLAIAVAPRTGEIVRAGQLQLRQTARGWEASHLPPT
jgi:hypothetical protein